MVIFAMPPKDASELLDYEIDMTKELAGRNPDGSADTLTAVTWSAASSGGLTDLTVEPFAFMTASTAIVWLAGGTVGSVYQVSALMTTTGGRTYHRSFNLPIETR
jgi:hypothetical protein